MDVCVTAVAEAWGAAGCKQPACILRVSTNLDWAMHSSSLQYSLPSHPQSSAIMGKPAALRPLSPDLGLAFFYRGSTGGAAGSWTASDAQCPEESGDLRAGPFSLYQ